MLVTALLDRAARRTGLQKTGSERADMLETLNDVYAEAVSESGVLVDRVDSTIVTSDDLYDIVDLIGEVPMGFMGIGRVEGGQYRQFRIVNHGYILEEQQKVSPGETQLVAPLGNHKLMFHPPLRVDDVIRFYYAPELVPLAETGNNDPGVLIPQQFHQSVLLAGVITQSLDKDQRKSDVEFWGARYEAGKQKLGLYVEEFMGEATPFYTSHAGIRVTGWPDERSR